MKYTYEVMINTDFPHAECELVLDITGRFIFKSSTVFFMCVCECVLGGCLVSMWSLSAPCLLPFSLLLFSLSLLLSIHFPRQSAFFPS